MKLTLLIFLALIIPFSAFAQSGVDGEVVQFSNNELGTRESCIKMTKIPGGDFSKKDLKKETSFCEIDLYSEKYAVCPKTWSTSPGTMIYKLGKSGISADEYEVSSYCGNSNKSKAPGVKKEAKLKTTMHQSNTSGTYSKSSLMYYQLSRYFDAKVTVPVSVYREFDRNVYFERGTAQLGKKRSAHKMNRAGWDWMIKALQGSYTPAGDMYADESKRNLYGIFIDGPGERYGPEFNGIRGGGYESQHKKFQLTPGFIALKTDKPLAQAIEYGVAQAGKSSAMKPYLKQLSGLQGQLQMMFWMRELIEINLLDFIFSQQDRVGNIDFRYYWYYVKDGKVSKVKDESDYDNKKRNSINKVPMTEELDGDVRISDLKPILVQRTYLNDNDAGTKVQYSNWSKKVGHLKGLKHFSLKLYRKVVALNNDLQSSGPISQWAEASTGLTASELKWFKENTRLATEILQQQCQSGMSFDLDNIKDSLVNGMVSIPSSEVDCENP